MSRPAARPPDPAARRQCGSCDLCCRLPTVDWPEYPELCRKADVPCPHLERGVGCRIHADRPMHCAAFQCLWLMGFGPDELRPDRIDGYFDAVDSGLLILITDKTKPDPRTRPEVEAFIDDWCDRRDARLLVYRGGREVRSKR